MVHPFAIRCLAACSHVLPVRCSTLLVSPSCRLQRCSAYFLPCLLSFILKSYIWCPSLRLWGVADLSSLVQFLSITRSCGFLYCVPSMQYVLFSFVQYLVQLSIDRTAISAPLIQAHPGHFHYSVGSLVFSLTSYHVLFLPLYLYLISTFLVPLDV